MTACEIYANLCVLISQMNSTWHWWKRRSFISFCTMKIRVFIEDTCFTLVLNQRAVTRPLSFETINFKGNDDLRCHWWEMALYLRNVFMWIINGALIFLNTSQGETAKYKKVAIVENFFDIIYNVHVNEGARGIQHAGQKRTHRSVGILFLYLDTVTWSRSDMFFQACSQVDLSLF